MTYLRKHFVVLWVVVLDESKCGFVGPKDEAMVGVQLLTLRNEFDVCRWHCRGFVGHVNDLGNGAGWGVRRGRQEGEVRVVTDFTWSSVMDY